MMPSLPPQRRMEQHFQRSSHPLLPTSLLQHECTAARRSPPPEQQQHQQKAFRSIVGQSRLE